MPAPYQDIDDLPAEARWRVDQICTRFENACRSGSVPKLEPFLREPDLSVAERSVLFQELLLLELEYRQRNGESVSRDELRARFPDDREIIEHALRVTGAEPPSTQPSLAGRTPHAEPPTGAERSLPAVPGYELIERIGSGGMAVVYAARSVKLNRLTALKLISAVEPSAELSRRLQFEAETVARLQHPNIVQIYDVGECPHGTYLALEYVHGGSLGELTAGTPQPPRLAAELVQPLARAVHFAHQNGVVHRDLKPANVLLSFNRKPQASASDDSANPAHARESHARACGLRLNDGDVVPRITDFGLAKLLGADRGQTASGVLVGTPSYMAPEQAAGKREAVGPAADIYALGAILYELLTGRPPFKAATVVETAMLVQSAEPVSPRQLAPNVPRDLETICLKCLMKPPQRRYGSAAELADDLGRFLAGESVRARPVGPLERAARWCQRRPAVAALGATLVLVTIAAFATITWQWHRAIALAAEAQRQELIAEANYAKVRAAIDDYFTTVSEETLLNQPGLQPLRTKLLAAALTHYQGLIDERQDDPDFEAELGAAHYRVGRIIQLTGNRTEAERPYGTAIEILEKVVAKNPDDSRSRQHLARCYNNLAALSVAAAGKPERAADLYEKARAMQQSLVEQNPAATEYRHTLASMHINIALLQHKLGKRDDARAGFEKAIAIQQQVVAEEPENAAYLNLLALANHQFASLGGEGPDASRGFRTAADIWERIVRENPGVPDYLSNLAASYTGLGGVASREGKWNEAADWHHKATEIAERLTAMNPAVREYREQWIRSYQALAVTHSRVGDHAAALAALQKVVASGEAVLQQNPGDHGDTIALAKSYNDLARTQSSLEQHDQALETLHKSLATLQSIADSGVVAYCEQLARCHRQLGHASEKTGRRDEAAGHYRESIRVREQLIARGVMSLPQAIALAQVCRSLGSLLKSDGQLDEAEAAVDKAIAVLEPICRQDPNNPRACEELGFAYTLRAQIRVEAGTYDDALSDWDGAYDLSVGRFRPQAAIMRAWTKAKLGRVREAVADLESLASADYELAASGEQSPGATSYTMARTYGLAALAAAATDQLAEAARRELADRYVERAVELLIRARDAGYFQQAAHVHDAESEDDLARVRQSKSIRDIVAAP